MSEQRSGKKIAFAVPTLNDASPQNEDVVQLLIFAAARLSDEAMSGAGDFSANIVSVERQVGGWTELSSLFPAEVLKRISIETLPDPVTPNLASAGHKPAYNFFEYMKGREFDEVHCLDHKGLAFYPTQAKALGLHFLNTVFSVHIVGSTIFRKETDDNLLEDIGALMDDVLERGTVERADIVLVHDRKAWGWYSEKIEKCQDRRIEDLAWPNAPHLHEPVTTPGAISQSALIYYGALGSEGGLPLFCDAIDRLLPKVHQPVSVYMIGPVRAIGGMDAVSYIRLRSGKWHVPVTIRRDLSIAAELFMIFSLHGVVFCDSRRRENLRSRLVVNSGIRLVHLQDQGQRDPHQGNLGNAMVPQRLAKVFADMLAKGEGPRASQDPAVVALWRENRPGRFDGWQVPAAVALQTSLEREPKVSVCITHFRRPEKLRTALASLRQQTYKNFEVIVVDDGSPDPDIQDELKRIEQEIRPLGWELIVQENRYLGAARNFGASRTTGEYLIFMDDDNVAKPGEIRTLVAVAHRTGAELVTAFCDVFEVDQDLEAAGPPRMRFTPFGPDPALGALSNCYGDANALYSRHMFEALGGFREDYGITHEDWEFFCRASLEGIKMVCVPESLFWYRVNQGAMFRGERTQLHKSANLRRHIRPYLEKLPYYQAKLVQLAQGLTEELPVATVGPGSRAPQPLSLRSPDAELPYGRVAIITRTKDRPLLLHRAIRSVRNQTLKDWVLVIVNDGGDPEGIDLVCREMIDDLSGRIIVLHHPVSLGMQAASNSGIMQCDSDFVIIHDDDDTWEPTFLARTVSHLDEHGWNPKLGGVITWSRVIVEEVGESGRIDVKDRYLFNDRLHSISLRDLAVENRFPPISFLFRRAALEAVGPFREQHGVLGDWEFHLRFLHQFDIDVIPEPLANYHHRARTTENIYSNSVHVQEELHRAKRQELLNSVIRAQADVEEGGCLSMGELLSMGDLQYSLLAEQKREFQRLHDYLWQIEQRVKYNNSGSNPSAKRKGSRNLASNGDFRYWARPGRIRKEASSGFRYGEISPGYVLSFDGENVVYRVERRKWSENGQGVPEGKHYLHIENDGQTRNGSWFVLECILSPVSMADDRSVCVSGVSRLRGAHNCIVVGGRHSLGDGRLLDWPEQRVTIAPEFERWSCVISRPPVADTERRRGFQSAILLKLPCDRPFEFDLTDFQVERGEAPTEFEYAPGVLSLGYRFTRLWYKAQVLPDRLRRHLRS